MPDRHRRAERRVLLSLAALVTAWLLAHSALHLAGGTLHLLPLFVLLVPLLLGRYVGEDLIARLRGDRARPAGQRAGARVALPPVASRAVRPVLRGMAMARRPPPVPA